MGGFSHCVLPRITSVFAEPYTILESFTFYYKDDLSLVATPRCRVFFEICISAAYKNLVWKPERKRPLGRPRRRCEVNIKTDLREIGWGGVNWIHLAQYRDQWRTVANTVMNLRVQ